MRTFTFPGWLLLSWEMGAKKYDLKRHDLFRAVFFSESADRDAFLQLCEEAFPYETFFIGTIHDEPAIQHKP